MRNNNRRKLFSDLRGYIRQAVPYSLTFAPCGKMTPADRDALEDWLKQSFENWAASWITPTIDAIEIAYAKPKVRKK